MFFRTLPHLIRRQLRRLDPSAPPPVAENVVSFADASGRSPESSTADHEWDRIAAAVDQLPPAYRLILQLSHGDGLSNLEISQRLDVPVSVIEKQHAHALHLLRELMHDEALTTEHDGLDHADAAS